MGETILRFGDIEVDRGRRSIRRRGELVPVPARAFDILSHLIENRDRVVSRRELMDVVWPDVVVEDGNLTQNVSVLRKAMVDDSADAPLILTIPGQGYRFTAAIEEGEAAAAPYDRRPSRWVRVAAAGLVIIAAMSAGLITLRGGAREATDSSASTRVTPAQTTESNERAVGTPSVAVLPIREGGLERPAGAEGLRLATELIGQLAEDRRLSIRPASDVLEFADPRRDTAAEAGEQLGVAYVIEGWAEAGPTTLVHLQLVDVRLNRVVWSGTWDDAARGVIIETIFRDANATR